MKHIYIVLILVLQHLKFAHLSRSVTFFLGCSPVEENFTLDEWRTYYKWGEMTAKDMLMKGERLLLPFDEDIAWSVWRKHDPSLKSLDREKLQDVLEGIRNVSLLEWNSRFELAQGNSNVSVGIWKQIYNETINKTRGIRKERREYHRLLHLFENVELKTWVNVYTFRTYYSNFTATEFIQYMLVRFAILDFTSVKWEHSMSADEFELSYCPYRCRDGRLVGINNLDSACPVVKCRPCSCHRPNCETYGICCPDISEAYRELPGLMYGVRSIPDFFNVTQRRYKVYDKMSPPSFHYSRNVVCESTVSNMTFLSIRSCPRDFTMSAGIVSQCVDDMPLHDVTTDNYLWAEDVMHDVVYHNMFCAVCNNATDPRKVSYSLYFPVRPKDFDLNTYDEKLRTVLRLAELGRGKVERHFPSRVTTFSCGEQDVANSDQWESKENSGSDLRLIFPKACLTMKDHYLRPARPMNYSEDLRLSPVCLSLGTVMRAASRDVAMQMDEGVFAYYNGAEGPVPSKYLGYMFSPLTFMPRAQARPARQNPTKAFVHLSPPLVNKKCVYSKPFLHYSIKMWMLPKAALETPMPMDNYGFHVMNNFTEKLIQLIINQSKTFNVTTGNLYRKGTKSQPQDFGVIRALWFVAKVYNISSQDMEQFQEYMTTQLISNGFEIFVLGNMSFSFSGLNMLERVKTIHYCRHFQHPSDSITCSEHAHCSFEDGEVGGPRCPNTLLNYETREMYRDLETRDVAKTPRLDSESIEDFNQEHQINSQSSTLPCQQKDIELSSLAMALTCSDARTFNRSQFNVTMDLGAEPPKINVNLNFDDRKMEFCEINDLNRMKLEDDDSLIVCSELLKDEFYETRYLVLSYSDWVLYILLLICVGCSIICLLITFMTYVRYRSLRNESGENNMFLSLCLLLAQCLLLVRVHRPSPLYLCVAVGVTSHYLWLWMFTWTFICCYHVVRTFGSSTRYTGWSVWRKLMASLVIPTAVVSAVIIGSYLTSRSIGYGLTACDLDTVTLVGFGLIGPMVAINLANLTCFLATVWYIHKLRRMQTFRKDNRSMFWNYVKLSSLIGLFWTMDIVAAVTNSLTLRILSILLNGLQGVFIFTSFMCNNKVFSLYKSSMKRNS